MVPGRNLGRGIVAFCVAIVVSGACVAQDQSPSPPPAVDPPYSLFNPQPREFWRELSADRPDTTESPITVPPGAVQLEMSLFDYAKDGGSCTWTAGAGNLKVGLTMNIDLQLVLDAWVHDNPARGSTEHGIGDAQIRVKMNLWGNDGEESTALAIMPFIKIPTADDDIGNGEIEGGLIVPFAVDIADGVGLGLMAEADAVYDEDDDDYDLDFVHTAVIGVDVTETIGWYIEGIGIAGTDADYRAILGSGFTFALRDDVILDFGFNLGLEGDVDDVSVFTGITVRF